MYALVDCNNFYVSCERIFQPKLRNRPVVVLSNNDGCIVARSNEVKSLGIKMGMPYFQAKELIKRHNIVTFSSNYPLYGDISSRVMAILARFSLNFQIYSIDEAFLDLSTKQQPLCKHTRYESETNSSRYKYRENRRSTSKGWAIKPTCGIKGDRYSQLACDIRKTVLQSVGIPVSVGIAKTRTLAKLANKLAKSEPSGCAILESEEDIMQAMQESELSDIWGIGKRSAIKLNAQGIYTIRQFVLQEDAKIRKIIGIGGVKTVCELRGIETVGREDICSSTRKSICSSRSFSHNICNIRDLKESIAYHTASALEKLRFENRNSDRIAIFLTYRERNSNGRGIFQTITANLAIKSNITQDFLDISVDAVDKLFLIGKSYKSAGVTLSSLGSSNIVQEDLFETQKSTKNSDALKVIDKINLKYGRNSIHFAAEGVDKKWEMKQSQRSPRYTTSWNDLLKVCDFQK